MVIIISSRILLYFTLKSRKVFGNTFTNKVPLVNISYQRIFIKHEAFISAVSKLHAAVETIFTKKIIHFTYNYKETASSTFN